MRRRGGGYGAALILSAAAHVLVLGLRFDVPLVADGRGSQPGQARPAGSVMRALDLVITPEAVSSGDVTAEATPPPDHPDPVGGTAPPDAAVNPSGAESVRQADADAGPRPDLSERLAPRMSDRRLWVGAARTTPADVEDAARVREPVRERIAALNDSIAAEAARERASADWTGRDDDGGRWGISPDRVHLGGLTLKLRHCTVDPCPGWLFPTPADRTDEYENRQRGFAEIRLQASQALLDEALADRATAIRKRMDARRDSSRGGGRLR